MKYLKIPIIKNEKVKEILLEIYNHISETTKSGAIDLLSLNYKGVNYVAVYKHLKRLEKERYIEISKKTNKNFFKLTSKGKNLAELIKFSLGNEKWDGKWRVLIFDIPERGRKRRDFLFAVVGVGYHSAFRGVPQRPRRYTRHPEVRRLECSPILSTSNL